MLMTKSPRRPQAKAETTAPFGKCFSNLDPAPRVVAPHLDAAALVYS